MTIRLRTWWLLAHEPCEEPATGESEPPGETETGHTAGVSGQGEREVIERRAERSPR